jgi:transposase-like protein
MEKQRTHYSREFKIKAVELRLKQAFKKKREARREKYIPKILEGKVLGD